MTKSTLIRKRKNGVRVDCVFADYWQALFFDGSLVLVREQLTAGFIIPLLRNLGKLVGEYHEWDIQLQNDHPDFFCHVPPLDDVERICREHVGDFLRPGRKDLVLRGTALGVLPLGLKQAQKMDRLKPEQFVAEIERRIAEADYELGGC